MLEETEDLVVNKLGACTCDNAERIDEIMLDFLNSFRQVDHDNDIGISKGGRSSFYAQYPNERKDEIESDLWLLLSYIADKFEWTEHGGSVYGAWICLWRLVN